MWQEKYEKLLGLSLEQITLDAELNSIFVDWIRENLNNICLSCPGTIRYAYNRMMAVEPFINHTPKKMKNPCKYRFKQIKNRFGKYHAFRAHNSDKIITNDNITDEDVEMIKEKYPEVLQYLEEVKQEEKVVDLVDPDDVINAVDDGETTDNDQRQTETDEGDSATGKTTLDDESKTVDPPVDDGETTETEDKKSDESKDDEETDEDKKIFAGKTDEEIAAMYKEVVGEDPGKKQTKTLKREIKKALKQN